MDDITQFLWKHAQGHVGLLASVAIFSGAALVSLIIQLIVVKRTVRLVDFADQCFPFRDEVTRSLRTDAMMFITGKLTRGLFGFADAALTLAFTTGVLLVLQALFPGHRAAPAGVVAMVAWSVVLFVVMDFGFYWTHYFEHHVDALWEIHKVHHSASALNPMTADRTHPLSSRLRHLVATVTFGLPAGIAMFLHGFQLPEVTALLINVGLISELLVLDVLHHTPFAISFGPFDRILISPRLHQGHHCARQVHWNRNFGGRLAIWDWMFGTLWLPAKDDIQPYGIGRGAAYNARYDSFYGAYIRPVIDAARVLAGRPPANLPPPES